MLLSNYHTHSVFCDGKGHPEEYIKKAIELNFHSIGFSGHAPVHVENKWTMSEPALHDYLTTLKELKEKYKSRIQVYIGLEIDYFPKISGPDSFKFKGLNLDYNIGSVHFVKNGDTGEYLTFDGSEEEYKRIIEVFFKGDVKAFVKKYYALIRGMLKEHKPNILGHIDLIKKNNKGGLYFDEDKKWYRDEVFSTLEEVKSSGVILEINTGAISRGYMKTPYPSDWILEQCLNLGIPVTINSDAHSPESLDTYFIQAENLMKNIGYVEKYIFDNYKWIPVKL